MHKTKSQLLEAGPRIFHDNARLHIAHVGSATPIRLGSVTHVPYSPDMSPSDLFLKLKESMRGRCYSAQAGPSAAVIRAIRQLTKDGVLYGIKKLPSRDSVFVKKGDYSEGL